MPESVDRNTARRRAGGRRRREDDALRELRRVAVRVRRRRRDLLARASTTGSVVSMAASPLASVVTVSVPRYVRPSRKSCGSPTQPRSSRSRSSNWVLGVLFRSRGP